MQDTYQVQKKLSDISYYKLFYCFLEEKKYLLVLSLGVNLI